MRHRATSRFWDLYESLPGEIQQLADRCFECLKDDPKHPSLRFKKVGRFWSARVGLHYRCLAIEDGEDFLWFWIGTHSEYDQLLSNS